MFKRLLKSDALMTAGGRLVAAYIRLVYNTSKIIRDPEDTDAKLLENVPLIFAMWHGQFMMLPKIRPKDPIDIRIMVARHADAELIGRALLRFDMTLLRGAGAGKRKRQRGGATALRSAIRALNEGATVAMTADVPPGPARRAGQGIVTLAQLSGKPVVPCAMATSRFKRLNTWSNFTVNLPFSELSIVVGDPILVSHDADAAAMEHARQVIENQLNAVTARAYQLVGIASEEIAPQTVKVPTSEYNPGFRLQTYTALTKLASPAAPAILKYRVKRGKEDPARENERLGIASQPRPDGNLLWFHAASVGETNAIMPLINELAIQRPDVSTLLTTGTVTSAKLAAQRLPANATHQYVPLDSPKFVARFLDYWQPDIALFTESEIWPNLISQTSKKEIPLLLLNGRLSPKSFRKWRRQTGFSRALFGRFDLVLAQNETLARRFMQLGVPNAISVGNLKIDSPAPPVDQNELKRLRTLLNGRRILVAASTHPGEDEIITEADRSLRQDFTDLLTIIVPRHPERGEVISTALGLKGVKSGRRSLGEHPETGQEIYIADTIGELGTFYSLGPVSVIGGSFVPHGGQNPVEAIKLGSGVITGPHWHNFGDAYREILRLRGCREVGDSAALASAVNDLFSNDDQLKSMTEHAEEALGNLSGAMARTLDALASYIPPQKGMSRAS